MTQALIEAGMAKKTTPVRVEDSSLRLARIASSYTGESVVDYISRVLAERAKHDIEALHSEMAALEESEKKPKRKPKGGE